MVTENTETTSATPTTEAPASTPVSVPEKIEAATETAPELAEGEEAPAKPVYNPNYKFKALGEEKEFDQWVRAAIKDADTEKKARELYEKSHGMDFIKADRDKIKENFSSLEQKATYQDQLIRTVTDSIAKKDFDRVFQGLGVSEDDVLKHALKIIQLREMPADQRQAYNQSQEASQRAEMLEHQNQMLSQQYTQVAVQARAQELDWTLQRPDLAQIATAYDSRVGVEGAFKQAVIERGKYHALTSGQDLTPEQAANEVVKFLGGPQAFAPSQNQVAAPNVMPEKKPVITNIQGKGTSPAKKVYKSLDDLKKLSKEASMAASND